MGRLPELPLELGKWLDPTALLCVLGFLALQAAVALLPLGRLVEGQISKQGIRRYRCNGQSPRPDGSSGMVGGGWTEGREASARERFG